MFCKFLCILIEELKFDAILCLAESSQILLSILITVDKTFSPLKILRFLTTQQQQSLISKTGEGLEHPLFQREYRNSQKAYKKMLIITKHQGNASKTSFIPIRMATVHVTHTV